MIETAPLSVPVETVTPIKPSEALRLGRLIRPVHVTASMFAGANAACALGAMAVGYGDGDPGDVGPRPGIESWRGQRERLMVRLESLGLVAPIIEIGMRVFDAAEVRGMDGDAAVLAYLSERGL